MRFSQLSLRFKGLGSIVAVASVLAVATPALAGDWTASGWHGEGWLGNSYGIWNDGYGFHRDPIVGVYGPSAFASDPYASYRNDNGCYRVLPVTTPQGVRLRRVFVCDF